MAFYDDEDYPRWKPPHSAQWTEDDIERAMGADKLRIAELESERDTARNRALKWRREAAYYRLREARCMGEANYTSVERVDELEGQRDMLAAALREIQAEAPTSNVSSDNYWKQIADKMGDIAARALAAVEPDRPQDALEGSESSDTL